MIFTGTNAAGETITYRDGKRYLWMLSFIPPLIPLLSMNSRVRAPTVTLLSVGSMPRMLVRYARPSSVGQPGAREVRLAFHSDAYARGRLITALSLLAVVGLLVGPRVRRRRSHA